MMMKNRTILLIGLALSLLISACGGEGRASLPAPQPSQTPVLPTATLAPTPTPTPSTLTICTRQDPQALNPYDGRTSISKQTALGILTGRLAGNETLLPLELTASTLNRVPVRTGTMVLTTSGEVLPLVSGLQVWPAGCHGPECALTWDGESELSMDQRVYQWDLSPDFSWQDGTPLQAQDFVLGFQASAGVQNRANLWRHDITESIKAPNARALTWTLVPGLTSPGEVGSIFPWLPLPSQMLADLDPSQIAASPELQEGLPSWGPYQLEAYTAGESMRFTPNPAYPGEREGLWSYDGLELRFVSSGDEALAAFSSGGCDVLDPSYHFDAADLAANGAAASLEGPEAMSFLVMGVKPAAFDDGHAAWSDERADYFGQPELREALLACLDLNANYQALAAPLYPEGFAGPEYVKPSAPTLPDPNGALEALGWQDADSDPATPRAARGLESVRDGTPLALRLHTGQSATDARYAAFIAQQLGKCGVAVEHLPLGAQELYAPGPEGPLFGRDFDLALVYFQPSGMRFCLDQTALQIPSAANHWVGMNISGYSSPAEEAACFSGTDPASTPSNIPSNTALPLIPHPQFWLGLKAAGE